MTPFAYALLAAATSIAPDAVPDMDGEEFAQVTIQQHIVIGVRTTTIPPQPDRPIKWKEKKGPKCIATSALAGAAVTGPDSIDLYLRGGDRVRAKLEDACPALDFYSRFYIRPSSDGRICADRDVIHARTGGKCGIEKFRTLVPDR